MAMWSAQWWKLSKNTAASNGSSATNPSMSALRDRDAAGPAQRCAISWQNFSSSSTAVTSSPVATRSPVRLPQPGPNSTIAGDHRRWLRSPGERLRLGEALEHMAPGEQIPTHQRQRPRLVREGTLSAAARSKGDASCAVS